MTLRTITFDDEQWQVVPREPNEAMVRAGLEASLTANKYLAMLDAAPEPPASMLTQRKLMRAINALGIDSRAGTPDYVLSDAIWAYLHGIPAKSLPAQPRRPYGTDTMIEYGVIPECDGPKPPAQEPGTAAEIETLRADSDRLRWLTEDHADPEARNKCREILGRMPVMSYSAACMVIDSARAALADGEASNAG